MEAYIFTSSLREYMRFRRLWPWLAVVVVAFFLSRVYHQLDPATGAQDAYALLSATIVFRVLALSAAIYSSAIVAQDVEQRTIVYLLTRPEPRWKLFVFRVLAAMLVVFLLSTLVAVATSLGTVGLSNKLLTRDIIALAAGSAAYMSLFTFVSLLMNRSMIACLLFAFVWETSVPNMPGDLYRLTISSYLTSIAQRTAPHATSGFLDALGGMLGVNTISVGAAWACIIGLTVVCLAAGSYWFSHFEYMAREDAE